MEDPMSRHHLKYAVAAFSMTVGVAAGALALQAGRANGFGPNIVDDQTLNGNLGVLKQRLAWLQSPESDAYQLAQSKTENADFKEVAQISTGSAAQGTFPSVSDDSSLNRANGIMSQLIAWQNSPQGDAFILAQAEPSVTGEDFQRVALALLR
jgi:hypothetical protein